MSRYVRNLRKRWFYFRNPDEKLRDITYSLLFALFPRLSENYGDWLIDKSEYIPGKILVEEEMRTRLSTGITEPQNENFTERPRIQQLLDDAIKEVKDNYGSEELIPFISSLIGLGLAYGYTKIQKYSKHKSPVDMDDYKLDIEFGVEMLSDAWKNTKTPVKIKTVKVIASIYGDKFEQVEEIAKQVNGSLNSIEPKP